MRAALLIARGLAFSSPAAVAPADRGTTRWQATPTGATVASRPCPRSGTRTTFWLVLGQEDHQRFDAAVRSRLAAVNGTISLETEDFPNDGVRAQALRVAELAEQAQASEHPDEAQILALREYRREAAQLVIDCAATAAGR